MRAEPHAMLVSIFNDVIGRIMRGPSRSHCAAALRIARDLVGGTPEQLLAEFDEAGSLPTTHESQGSDMGLCGGLLGWEADDPRLPDSLEALRAAGAEVRFATVRVGDLHLNTYRLTLVRGGVTRGLRVISTGGGMIEVITIDDVPLAVQGDYHETLFHLADASVAGRLAAGFETLAPAFVPGGLLVHEGPGRAVVQMQTSDSVPVDVRRWLAAAARPAVGYEMARGRLSDREVVDRMVAIVRLLKGSIAAGIAGTHWDDRVLPTQAPGFAAALAGGRLVGDRGLNRIVLATTALMEVKSSMGVIVAAPTAGARAALPAAVITLAAEMGLDDEAIARGLICDPVANRVEAPCLGNNVMAAANALACANMALAGFAEVTPFAEVIDAARRVAGQMPRELGCTALGGLAITPRSLAIERRLADGRAARCCGGGCCGG